MTLKQKSSKTVLKLWIIIQPSMLLYTKSKNWNELGLKARDGHSIADGHCDRSVMSPLYMVPPRNAYSKVVQIQSVKSRATKLSCKNITEALHRLYYHTLRVCFKGDEASQWKRPKFDPSPRQNPLTDLHQNWHAWLCPGRHQACKI